MGAQARSRNTIVYTQGYAGPEQRAGYAETRSDLFSLAATLYHLATGKEPDAEDTAGTIAGMLADPASPIPAEYRWFFELLRINLAADPNDRYCTAEQFKADLELGCVTTEKDCPRCRTPNAVSRPYCVRCAEPLTPLGPACRECGQDNRMGGRWCIHCGRRLR